MIVVTIHIVILYRVNRIFFSLWLTTFADVVHKFFMFKVKAIVHAFADVHLYFVAEKLFVSG